jgi:diphosphoinositol-polyphosphate diphosphatase
LLIQSTRRGGWVLPKGGWELDEATPQDAAKREAWEEAGIITTITRDLGTICDTRKPQEMTGHAPKAKYRFFEANVDKEEAEYPEKAKRDRKWMKYTEAREALKDRPELAEALERSSVKR